jgi:hypothetical protein
VWALLDELLAERWGVCVCVMGCNEKGRVQVWTICKLSFPLFVLD